MTPLNFTIAIHGGAGTILRSNMTPEKELAYKRGLEDALVGAEQILVANGSAIDAVERAVMILEDNILFNAGRGAVFTHGGKNEMDAAIMEGKMLRAGACTCVEGIRNPIMLARAIMERSDHVFMSGTGAAEFAQRMEIPFEEPEYFFSQDRYDQLLRAREAHRIILDHTNLNDKKFGTVGAVAVDNEGNLAAATSTGGMTNKRFGRVGDSPIIGAGTWASDETIALSATGAGEFFIRAGFAHQVHSRVAWGGSELVRAARDALDDVARLGGHGGCVAVDRAGRVTAPFTTSAMPRAYQAAGGPRAIHVLEATGSP